MTDDKKEEIIEVEFRQPVYEDQDYEGPFACKDWGWQEPPQQNIRGLLIFHLDVYNSADEAELKFRNKHADLFDQLTEQGIRPMIFCNNKSNAGVRVEYIHVGY